MTYQPVDGTATAVEVMTFDRLRTLEQWQHVPETFDAYRASVAGALAFPDTGDVEADLRAQLRSFVRPITETRAGHVVSEPMGQSQTDPELKTALIEYFETPRRALAIEAMERGRARGQLRGDVDPQAVVDQLWGACNHRLLNSDLPITAAFADSLLDNLWRGISA